MTPRFALTALVALVALPRLASASVGYPEEVQKQWQLQQLPGNAPHCTMCHQTDTGGTGTSTKFFSRSLQSDGLVALNVGSLDAALAADKAAGTDSDGDGISDFDELQMATDPNDGPGPIGGTPFPQTGCAISSANGGAGGESATWLLSLGVAALVVRKRRRQ